MDSVGRKAADRDSLRRRAGTLGTARNLRDRFLARRDDSLLEAVVGSHTAASHEEAVVDPSQSRERLASVCDETSRSTESATVAAVDRADGREDAVGADEGKGSRKDTGTLQVDSLALAASFRIATVQLCETCAPPHRQRRSRQAPCLDRPTSRDPRLPPPTAAPSCRAHLYHPHVTDSCSRRDLLSFSRRHLDLLTCSFRLCCDCAT